MVHGVRGSRMGPAVMSRTRPAPRSIAVLLRPIALGTVILLWAVLVPSAALISQAIGVCAHFCGELGLYTTAQITSDDVSDHIPHACAHAPHWLRL